MNEPFNQELYNARLQYITNELNDTGFSGTAIGKQIIEYISYIYRYTNCNDFARNKLTEMVDRLFDQMPLSPITEDEFYFDEITQTNKCVRYEWLIRAIDGNYYDTHAICFINPDGTKGYKEDGEYRSTKQVQLPYYPTKEYVYIK